MNKKDNKKEVLEGIHSILGKTDEKFVNPIDNPQLSYKDNDGVCNSVRKVTDTDSIRNKQHIQDKSTIPKNMPTI